MTNVSQSSDYLNLKDHLMDKCDTLNVGLLPQKRLISLHM